MVSDVTFRIRVVFSCLLGSREERSDVGQSMIKIGGGNLLSKCSLVHNRSYLYHSEGMFETRCLSWFDVQGKGHVARRICITDPRGPSVSASEGIEWFMLD